MTEREIENDMKKTTNNNNRTYFGTEIHCFGF